MEVLTDYEFTLRIMKALDAALKLTISQPSEVTAQAQITRDACHDAKDAILAYFWEKRQRESDLMEKEKEKGEEEENKKRENKKDKKR